MRGKMLEVEDSVIESAPGSLSHQIMFSQMPFYTPEKENVARRERKMENSVAAADHRKRSNIHSAKVQSRNAAPRAGTEGGARTSRKPARSIAVPPARVVAAEAARDRDNAVQSAPAIVGEIEVPAIEPILSACALDASDSVLTLATLERDFDFDGDPFAICRKDEEEKG